MCEGSGENIYVVRDGPDPHPAADGRHPRRDQPQVDPADRRATSGIEVVERDLARAELYLADEVFLSGTAAELVPVREIDDHAIGAGEPGPITRELQRVFDDALHGRDPRYARVARRGQGAVARPA